MGQFVEEDIAGYLESNLAWLRRSSTVGTPGEQNFFIGDLPSSPTEAVALNEYPGDQPLYFLGGGGSEIERPRIQLTVRAEDYERSRELVHEIYDLVKDHGPFTLNGTTYLKFRAISRPSEISPDAENRTLFSLNVMMWREA